MKIVIAAPRLRTMHVTSHCCRKTSIGGKRWYPVTNNVCMVVLAATYLSLAAGCAADAWPVPDGTPPNIAKACREQAALAGKNNMGNLQERTGNEIAGAADDTIEDARAAKRDDMKVGQHGEELFHQCLRENGVLVDPADGA